jgi:hypothetical protein
MNRNRVISGLISVIYVIVAFVEGGAEPAFKVGLFLIFPLACIWFADAMGGYIGPTTNMAISASSPPVILCILGWLLLVTPLIMALIFHGQD